MCVQGHDLDRVTEEGERKESKRDETAAVRHGSLALEQSQHQAGTVQGIPLCVMLLHHLSTCTSSQVKAVIEAFHAAPPQKSRSLIRGRTAQVIREDFL